MLNFKSWGDTFMALFIVWLKNVIKKVFETIYCDIGDSNMPKYF
jgi:hypothetical protein